MALKVLDFSLQYYELKARMPFKYGIATLEEVPHVFVSLKIQDGNRTSTGFAADHLPPKWFTKEPEVPVEQEILDMKTVIRQALETAMELEVDTAFQFWRELYLKLMLEPEYPSLLQHFGISLVERALLDACCRESGMPLWQLVKDNRLGIELESLSPELSGFQPSDFLPPKPLSGVTLRHTVGLADYLLNDDIPQEELLRDGLPQSLEASISRYGLKEFKLKLCGNEEADLQRLRAIAKVVQACSPADFSFSLDGNEQFTSPDQFRAFGEAVFSDNTLRSFFKHLHFIEQPISRKVALSGDALGIGNSWPDPVPFIIDESDGALDDLELAFDLGYAGASHKNCKGIFKGIRNKCLIAYQQIKYPGSQYIMTGEDLCNIGPVALTQDLAVQALLGNASVERNGHHYFKGLSMFPRRFSSETCDLHTGLYTMGEDGYAYLRVKEGQLDLSSVNSSLFGTSFIPDRLNTHPEV